VRSIENFHICILLLISFGTCIDATAYIPAKKETLARNAELSDTFICGVVKELSYRTLNNAVITVNTIEVKSTQFDNTGKTSKGERIKVITAGGVITDNSGKRKIIKEIHSPLLEQGQQYLLYLRWEDCLDAFILTLGESSVFQVDDAGKVLTSQGYYIVDIQNDEIVLGTRRESPQRSSHNRKTKLPDAVIYDCKGGNKTIVRPSSKEDHDKNKAMNIQEFVKRLEGFGK